MKYVLLTLAALAAAVPTVYAGPIGGAGCRIEAVQRFATDEYRVTFYGGQTARVSVSGDRDTDLDLYVYDEFGNLIASDTDLSDQCVVGFTPRWTGKFVIRVVNRGGVYNRYTICAA